MLVAASMLLGSHSANAQLIINELMQSNIDCVMDDRNEFPDSWVELYNTGDAAVNLNRYRIGITDDVDAAWKLPGKKINPKEHILIYCDKEATDRHTDFRLDSGKGAAVYLFEDGKLVDQVTGLKKQPAPNIAYGRKTTGADKWGYMLTPTPAAANEGGTSSDILGEPVFSAEGGIASSSRSFTLTLSMPKNTPDGAVIRYTLDGSEPTAESPLYTDGISISGNKIVRAKLFCDGWLSPRSTVRSYLMLGHAVTLPVISIVTDNRYFYDNKIGIYVDGNYSSQQKNYQYDWRRPINLEMYEADGTTCILNQLCETRIMGAYTRSNPLKSLAIYANKRFGTKRFEYEFFPDQRPGQTNYKSLALRNAGNDFYGLYMRDAIIQRTMAAHTDLDWQAWRPAVVYINGKYRGMLNIRERSNDDNIFTNYEELEDIDLIENWTELKNGTMDNLNAFTKFYNEHDHTKAEYDKWMDTDEFINLMVGNMYYCNLDFPANNIVMWRPRAEGGRWRWIMKDTDFGLGHDKRAYTFNTVAWMNDNGYDPSNTWGNTWEATRLFRRLMEDADFSREFIDRCAVYMGDFLNERGTCDMWNPMYDMIKYELPYHRTQYNGNMTSYSNEMSYVQTWVRNRTAYFYKHLADYYKLGKPTFLKVTQSPNTQSPNTQPPSPITINGIRLSEGRFDGRYFQGLDLTLSNDDDTVKGWRITTNGTTTISYGSQYTFTMPSTEVQIEALATLDDGIDNVTLPVAASPITDILGRPLPAAPAAGIYLQRMNDGTVRKIAGK